jgi:hypothetical protein
MRSEEKRPILDALPHVSLKAEARAVPGHKVLTDLLGQVEIVPAGDGIFDEAFATLGHFLFLLFRLRKLPWISDGHGP